MELLRVEGLYKYFGGVHALSNVSFEIEAGEHLVIIGPNGAGKTTLFNLLGGQLQPTAGRIFYCGRDITRVPSHRRIQLGIGRSFQIASLFNNLSVMENVRLAIQGTSSSRYQMFHPITRYSRILASSLKMLASMDLLDRRHHLVSSIPYGAQRKLEIILGLAAHPKLLLLDEPSCGLTAEESADVINILSHLETDVGMICVAHDMDLVFGIASRIMVLHYGEIIADGEPEKIRNDPTVKEIYLGIGESGK